MFPMPFQCLSAGNLPDVFGWFVMSWMVMGVPSILVLFGASCLFKGFKLDRMAIFKHLGFWRAGLTVLLLAAAGYYEAWTYRAEMQPPANVSHWYYYLAIPGVPGDMMANSYGGDWQDDEAWDYRSDIAIWNGLFWTSVAAIGLVVMRFVFRHLYTFTPPVVDPPCKAGVPVSA
jgi:hypothetical protein